jgi:diguanylate cyclase (GGDEF)-like protein
MSRTRPAAAPGDEGEREARAPVELGLTGSAKTFGSKRLGPPVSRETAWLLPIIAPVSAIGAAALTGAVWSFADSPPSATAVAGLLFLLAAAVLAEAYPVPIQGIPVGATSLASIFIVGAAVIHGWAASVLVASCAMAIVEAIHRRPPLRSLYNTALYTVAAGAAGGAVVLVTGETLLPMLAAALTGSTIFYVVDIGLLTLVLARTEREPLGELVRRCVASTLVPFLIMASVTLILVVLWLRSPYLTAMLVGPLGAVALYQRSVHETLEALRLAKTDALTGLGNARGFNERLDEELEEARDTGRPLAVCLLDVDDFKSVNDLRGHGVGDQVLAELARELRHDGEAFRLGGDEFALVLPDCDEHRAAAIGRAVVERVANATLSPGVQVSMSGGVASYPRHASAAGELVRLADGALYRSKEEGKNRVVISAPGSAEMNELRRLADETDRTARLRAAASLAEAVDARDAYTGRHSFAVGELAARVALRLGLDPYTVELTRLAGRLHDLGKLGIPTEVLRKSDALTEDERRLLRQHCQIGFRMLDSLGVEPVATWVLHHHERWDGRGYPSGLAGDDIPLAARIIFIADAFDAMTGDRVYRPGMSQGLALEELARNAGTQFDPVLVAAFADEIAGHPADAEARRSLR